MRDNFDNNITQEQEQVHSDDVVPENTNNNTNNNASNNNNNSANNNKNSNK